MQKLAIILLCLLVSTSFAGRRARAMQQEIAALRDSTNASLAEIDARISEIEERQRQFALNQERFDIMLNDVSPTRLEEFEIQLAYLTEAFRDLFTSVRGLQLIPIIQQAQRTAPRPPGFTLSDATLTLGGNEFALYSRALNSFRNRFFRESRQIMRELIVAFPNGRYFDRAHFWIAESYFQQRNYVQALKYYQVVLNFAGTSKADDAQYRIAICYLMLGEHEMAQQEFTRLIHRFPASRFIPRATEALRQLKIQRNNEAIRAVQEPEQQARNQTQTQAQTGATPAQPAQEAIPTAKFMPEPQESEKEE